MSLARARTSALPCTALLGPPHACAALRYLFPDFQKYRAVLAFVFAAAQVGAGDICALSGIADIKIGETICAREAPNALPTIQASPRLAREPIVNLLNLLKRSKSAASGAADQTGSRLEAHDTQRSARCTGLRLAACLKHVPLLLLLRA